jgi:hypothetical protein
MRACAPVCVRMSITCAAIAMPAKAACSTAAREPTNVTTVRLVSAPGSTLSSVTPLTASMASVMRLIFARSRPSEKFGTHSTMSTVDVVMGHPGDVLRRHLVGLKYFSIAKRSSSPSPSATAWATSRAISRCTGRVSPTSCWSATFRAPSLSASARVNSAGL